MPSSYREQYQVGWYLIATFETALIFTQHSRAKGRCTEHMPRQCSCFFFFFFSTSPYLRDFLHTYQLIRAMRPRGSEAGKSPLWRVTGIKCEADKGNTR